MTKKYMFITIWTWIQYLFAVFGVLGLVFVFLFPTLLNLANSLKDFQIILLLIIYILICPTILWGIKNKHPEGYYASWIFIIIFMFIAVPTYKYWIGQNNFLIAFVGSLLRIVIGLIFTYNVYKTRSYYGID